jgi:mono/diheme cytochrome c family protein
MAAALSPPAAEGFDERGRLPLPESPQRQGDPEKGRDYLVNGDYLKSGVPLAVFRTVYRERTGNELNREGENATLPPSVTAVKAPNGEVVVATNCLSCHAQQLRGQFILGLGNSLRDFTEDAAANVNLADGMLRLVSVSNPAPREAFAPFRDAVRAVAPHIRTQVAGTNPALKLAYILAAHRDPETLEWSDKPLLPLPPAEEVVPSDVPALWLLRKKRAMFHNGMGQGDFARVMMASSLLTMRDAGEAAEIDAKFVDVRAFLDTLRPPAFPGPIDPVLRERGGRVFARNCSSCHGSYGEGEDYPNLLVSLDEVGTDPALALAAIATQEAQSAVYNHSWFGQGEYGARLEPLPGYVAPPLDGVWATAPYLHNGSVPTLEALLDSTKRPERWRRSFSQKDYDLGKVGWKHSAESAGGHKHIYDTTLHGHSADGHLYGDDLEDEERRALLEYLKTL